MFVLLVGPFGNVKGGSVHIVWFGLSWGVLRDGGGRTIFHSLLALGKIYCILPAHAARAFWWCMHIGGVGIRLLDFPMWLFFA
jgi:hypothetical protein